MSPTSSKSTIYFGYGSNLWLHQMSIRCPTSTYLGVARLNNYKWIINDRGYANVVEVDPTSNSTSISTSNSTSISTSNSTSISTSNSTSISTPKNPPTSPSPSPATTDYSNVVFGLVYSLKEKDEKRLDKNEGVPHAYTKEFLDCDFWSSSSTTTSDTGGNSKPVDVSKPPTSTLKMLVYIDRKRAVDDKPKEEYIYRMNKGIEDALKMGVPEGYVEDVMRKFIPADSARDDGDDVQEWRRESTEIKALRQALMFVDENEGNGRV